MHKNVINEGVCPVCSNQNWIVVYQGDVRDGAYGRYLKNQSVFRCQSCGIDKLHLGESLNIPSFYETGLYREYLGQNTSPDTYYFLQDLLQVKNLELLSKEGGGRGKVVADIGCAAGGILSYVAGLAKACVAIEPCVDYHDHLRSLGYKVFSNFKEAHKSFNGLVDVALSSQVIEHVEDPLSFLTDIKSLLGPSGKLILTTPNRNHILMKILPVEFQSFFYRAVHLWYFDMDSLENCVRAAGYRVLSKRFINQYGLSNTLAWLRDKAPKGNLKLDGVNSFGENLWDLYLESTGQSDTIAITIAL